MNNIKAVLFDLDGTLIDTAPDFIRIIKVMCANTITHAQQTSKSVSKSRQGQGQWSNLCLANWQASAMMTQNF